MKILFAILLWPLVKLLGCPCCGPDWYARPIIWADEMTGTPVPPELEGWRA